MLTKVRRLNDSVLVLELENGFAVGCETSNNEETKFAALRSKSDLAFGSNAKLAQFVTNGNNTSFSINAGKILDYFVKGMEDPISQIRSKLNGAYDRLLESVNIQPVYEKNSVEGVRITNKRIFSDKPKGDDYIGIIDISADDEGLNPDFFGDSSSVNGRKAFLIVVFPDGLELSESCVFHPVNKNNYNYRSAKHFLKTERDLINEVYSLAEQEQQSYKEWRDFRENLKPEEVGAVLKTLEAR